MAVFVLLWSIAALLCVETAKAQSVVATLSADGTRIPGGYVVPVGGNITFTCSHNGSSRLSLIWQVIIVNGTATTITTTAFNLRDEPGLSSPATSNTANPVNLTIHSLQLTNNGSTVTCQLEAEGSPTVIIVEGVPACPMVNLSSLTAEASSLAVTLSAVGHPWFLPVCFNVTVSSSDFPTWSFNTKENKFNISPVEPSTVYNFSVIPCNTFGCNEGCIAYTIATRTPTSQVTDVAIVDNLPLWAIIVIPLVILFALITAIIAVAAIVMKFHAKFKLFGSGAEEKCGKEERGIFEGGGNGGKEMSKKAESQIEEAIESVEMDVNPAYISLN